MKKTVFICCALLWWLTLAIAVDGCAALSRWHARNEQRAFVRSIKYRLDPRTGICFAVRAAGGIAVVDRRHCRGKR